MTVVNSITKSELFFNKVFPIYQGFILSRAIYAITKLKIAEELVAGPLTIAELAKRLKIPYASNLERVLNFLASNGIFTKDNGCFSQSELSQDLLWINRGKNIIADQDRRWSALSFADESSLKALEVGNDKLNPVEQLARLYVQARAIYIACCLKIFEKVQKNRAVDTVILKHLEQIGLVTKEGLTETGELFLDKKCQGLILYENEDRWNALACLEQTITEGIVPFEKTFGYSYFEYLRTRPQATELFSDAMTFVSEYESGRLIPCLREVLKPNELKTRLTIADIGGGQGRYIQEILKAYPHVQGILFDLQENIASCVIDSVTKDRCQLVPGDFFKEIPQADVLLFKRVLHDWSDEDCLKILKQCRRAALPSTQLVVHEMMFPEPKAFMFDVQFMTFMKGQQRTLEDFARLLDESGWKLESTTRTECWISQIVAIPK